MTLASTDYARQLRIAAPAPKVFQTLTSITAFASWWAPATGAATEGGTVAVDFGLPEPLQFYVRQAAPPSTISWEITDCSFLPDWAATTITFTLAPTDATACELHFRHQGLHDQLDHYADYAAGWDQYLASLRDYIQAGTGNPFNGVVRVMQEQAGGPA